MNHNLLRSRSFKFAWVLLCLLTVSCAQQTAPTKLEPSPYGPKPGTHGHRDHCEVRLTACTDLSYSAHRGAWIIGFDAECSGRTAEIVCHVANILPHLALCSVDGIATITTEAGTSIKLAPEWPSPFGPGNEYEKIDVDYIDPCAQIQRVSSWEWRVPIGLSLVCEEKPSGSVKVVFNESLLSSMFATKLHSVGVTVGCAPAAFVVPLPDEGSQQPDQSPGADVGGGN